jgi:hypothetical protein
MPVALIEPKQDQAGSRSLPKPESPSRPQASGSGFRTTVSYGEGRGAQMPDRRRHGRDTDGLS